MECSLKFEGGLAPDRVEQASADRLILMTIRALARAPEPG
jgi:hypothetical protein